MEPVATFRSGFVALVGRPNVGKSTLLNTLVGQKVVIVSDKPQTTRNQIRCILNRPGTGVFLDTPACTNRNTVWASGWFKSPRTPCLKWTSSRFWWT